MNRKNNPKQLDIVDTAIIEAATRHLMDYPPNHPERAKIEAFIAHMKGETP